MADKITPEKLTTLQELGYRGDDSLEMLLIRINDLMIEEGIYENADGMPWWVDEKDKEKNKAKLLIDVIADALEKKYKDKAKEK